MGGYAASTYEVDHRQQITWVWDVHSKEEQAHLLSHPYRNDVHALLDYAVASLGGFGTVFKASAQVYKKSNPQNQEPENQLCFAIDLPIGFSNERVANALCRSLRIHGFAAEPHEQLMSTGEHHSSFSHTGEDKFYVSLPLPQTSEEKRSFAAAIKNLTQPLTSIIDKNGEYIPLPPPAEKKKHKKPATTIDETGEHTPPKKRSRPRNDENKSAHGI